MASFDHQERRAKSRKASTTSPLAVARALEDRSSGEPLPSALAWALGETFGDSFDDVRVHADGRADELAQGLGAEAFTRGRDIYFRHGRYDGAAERPGPLLAHEASHVVQQRGGTSERTLDRRGDTHERQAGAAARAVALGAGAEVSSAGTPPRLQRFGSTEHERLGDVTGVRDIDLGGGVHLSWGQLVALAGDYYATVEDLLDDTRTPAGKVRIRAALEHYHSPTPATTLPPATAPDTEAAGNRLVLLALRNVSHFVEGGDAHATWLDYHARAIGQAIVAGLARDRTKLEEAYVLEAFGQHYLTDSFAAGHIRTPRRDIMDWYVGTFAPRVFDHLVRVLRNRVVDGVIDQLPAGIILAAYLAGAGAVAALRAGITVYIQRQIDDGITAIGGRTKAIEWLGLGAAGAVSGAMHDVENAAGLVVSSTEHPGSWSAFGDSHLDDIDPISGVAQNRIQAENAVKASKKDVDDAFAIAEAESTLKYTATVPAALPSAVYFDFDHSDLSPAVQRAVRGAALYMVYNPDAEVDLVGHTDPVGTDSYNDDLSLDRANEVAAAITREGVSSRRLSVSSRGERDLVTPNPREYWRNRRVALVWRTSGTVTATHDVALEHVQSAVRTRVGPPYRAQGFLPTPVPGANRPLPDWHWGAMPKTLRSDVGTWIGGHVVGPLTAMIAGSKALAPHPISVPVVGTITIEPRVIATNLATEFATDPIAFLETAFGETAGP